MNQAHEVYLTRHFVLRDGKYVVAEGDVELPHEEHEVFRHSLEGRYYAVDPVLIICAPKWMFEGGLFL